MDHLLPLSKTHIKHFPHLEHFECTVCFELEPTAMRCSGPCKAALCLKCATAICKNNNKANCPQRCSNNPLRLEPIPDFKLQFNCPYDAENCKANIEGHQGFVDHCQTCEHITTEAVQENLRKDQYICKQGHSLLFLDPNVSLHAFNQLSLKTITHRCAGCGEMRFCRSYCRQCSIDETVAYCNDCRALPCTKDVCPLGHEFVRIEAESNYYCDLCGFCIFLFSNHRFRDQECNFDICAACYHRLPQTHPLVPLQANLAHTIQFGKIQHKKPPQEDQHYSSSFSDEEEEEQGEDDNAIQFQNHFQEDSNEEEDEPDEQQEQEEQEEEQEEQQEQEEQEEEVMPADEPQLSDQEEIYFQQEQEYNSDFQNQNGEWFQDID